MFEQDENETPEPPETPAVEEAPEEDAPETPETPEGEGEEKPDAEPEAQGVEAAVQDATIAELVEHYVTKQADGSLTREEIDALSPAEKALVARLLADIRVRGEASTAEGAALEARRRAAQEQERAASRSRQAFLSIGQGDEFEKLLAKYREPVPAGTDPLSPEAMQAQINNGVAKALEEMFGVAKAQRERLAAEEARVAAAAELEAKKADLAKTINDPALEYDGDETFLDEDGQRVTRHDYIVREFQRDPDRHASPSKVYRRVWNRAAALYNVQAVESLDRDAVTRAREAAGKRPGRVGHATAPVTPTDLSTEDLIRWYERYPEAMKRDAARMPKL